MRYIQISLHFCLALFLFSCGSTRPSSLDTAAVEDVFLAKDIGGAEVDRRFETNFWKLTDIREQYPSGGLGPSIKDSLLDGREAPIMKGRYETDEISLYGIYEKNGKVRCKCTFLAGHYDNGFQLRFGHFSPAPFSTFGVLRIEAFSGREMRCTTRLTKGDTRKDYVVTFQSLDSLQAQSVWRMFSESMLTCDEVLDKASFDSLFQRGSWSFAQCYDVYPSGLLSQELSYGKSGSPLVYYQWENDSLYMKMEEFSGSVTISGSYSYAPPVFMFLSDDRRIVFFNGKVPYTVLSAREDEIRLLAPTTNPREAIARVLVMRQHNKINMNARKR